MRKYYYNIHYVSPSADDVGEEHSDDEAAWREATVIAARGKFRPVQKWALELTDEARKPIYVIRIEARNIERF
jgi:hypothetical protein